MAVDPLLITRLHSHAELLHGVLVDPVERVLHRVRSNSLMRFILDALLVDCIDVWIW